MFRRESPLMGGATGHTHCTPERRVSSDSVLLFEVKCSETLWGDTVVVVGSCAALGAWDAPRGLKLSTSEHSWPIWRGEHALPEGPTPVEYKIVILRATGDVHWETLACNRKLAGCDSGPFDWTLACMWGQPGESLQRVSGRIRREQPYPRCLQGPPAPVNNRCTQANSSASRGCPQSCPAVVFVDDSRSPSSAAQSPYTQTVPSEYMQPPTAPEEGRESPPPLDENVVLHPRHAFYASPNKSDPLCPIVSVGNADWSPNSSMGDLTAMAT